MRYHGKNIDTFENALSMLYRNSGYIPEKHADCISGRAFVFKAEQNDLKNWLSSGVAVDDAVRKVAAYNNLLQETDIFYSIEDCCRAMEWGCFLGPVDILAQDDIQSFYYNGKRRYLYVCGQKDGIYAVHDPEGFPLRLYRKEELLQEYDLSQSIAVRMRSGGCQKKRAFIADVIRYQLIHRRSKENWDLEGDMGSWLYSGGGRKKDLALQFGWNLYLHQIWKIVQILETEGLGAEVFCEKLEYMLEKLYGYVWKGNMLEILLWRNNFWKCMEEAVGMDDKWGARGEGHDAGSNGQ